MLTAGEPSSSVFDLESPLDARKLAAPLRTLGALDGLVVLDEVQHKPDLFEVLRVLLDRHQVETRFLSLGSVSPALVKGISESLAGRVGFVDLAGFDLRETGAESRDRLWSRGGFPRSFLALDDTRLAPVAPRLCADLPGARYPPARHLHPGRDATQILDHDGAELDLMVTIRGRRYGFEIKVTDSPGPTRSMRIALSDLGLEHLWVLYPGTDAYALDERLSVLPVTDVARLPARLAAGTYRL